MTARAGMFACMLLMGCGSADPTTGDPGAAGGDGGGLKAKPPGQDSGSAAEVGPALPACDPLRAWTPCGDFLTECSGPDGGVTCVYQAADCQLASNGDLVRFPCSAMLEYAGRLNIFTCQTGSICN